MIQKSTVLWLCLSVAAGTALFHTSERVHQASERLREAEHALADEKENLRVLEAEWSYLNQPERLKKLALQVLDLKPAAGAQLAGLERLGEEVVRVDPPKNTNQVVAEKALPAAERPVSPPPAKTRSFSAVLASLGVGSP